MIKTFHFWKCEDIWYPMTYSVICVLGKPDGSHRTWPWVLNDHDQRCLAKIACHNRQVILAYITSTINTKSTRCIPKIVSSVFFSFHKQKTHPCALLTLLQKTQSLTCACDTAGGFTVYYTVKLIMVPNILMWFQGIGVT